MDKSPELGSCRDCDNLPPFGIEDGAHQHEDRISTFLDRGAKCRIDVFMFQDVALLNLNSKLACREFCFFYRLCVARVD